MSINFYKDKVCLNCLTQSVENAKQIYEVCEGHVVVGLLTANYPDIQQAVADMKLYQKPLNNHISVGLGQGNPMFWERVVKSSMQLQPAHINQVFPSVGYTRGAIQNDEPFINALVSPSGIVGKVIISTGYLSNSVSEPAVVDVRSAIQMVKEMGGNSLKFFPMHGLKTRDELIEVAKACAELDFGLEPTGGIDLDNFEEILQIIVDAGVKKIIPHVYSSIIDPKTKLTRIEDVQKLYDIIKRVVK